jgi:hypothetical protein
VRFTAAQAAQLVDGAQRSGRFHPRSRDAYLVRVMAGGRAGAQAIADLMAMVPADQVTRAKWARQRRPRTAAARQAVDPDDEVYARLWPTPEQLAARPEVDPFGAETRQAWLRQQQAAGLTPPGVAPPPPGVGSLDGSTEPGAPGDEADPAAHLPSTGTHAHVHSAYAGDGATHSHSHTHAGDASHAPGDSHQHAAEPADAAAAGIAARRAERIRANPADAAAGDTDERLFDRLFGRPPGRGRS